MESIVKNKRIFKGLVVVGAYTLAFSNGASAATCPEWSNTLAYEQSQQVSYNGTIYEAVTAISPTAAGNPNSTPALWNWWKPAGSCTNPAPSSATASPTPSATPSSTPSSTPTATPSASPTSTPLATPTATPTVTPSPTPSATETTCPEWSHTIAYQQSQQVSYNGTLYQAVAAIPPTAAGNSNATPALWNWWQQVSSCTNPGPASGPLLTGPSGSSSPTPSPTPSVTPTPTSSPTPSGTPSPVTAGRIIGYIPGWANAYSGGGSANPGPTPAPSTLANAGYTHLIVAFGLLSTTTPGAIVDSAFALSPNFPSGPNMGGVITPSYIQALHKAGIKVLLSIGGASTGISGTAVNFDQVLTSSNPSTFESNMVSSIQNIVSYYGFDGVDFDIEQGFAPASGGTLTNPGGDVQVLGQIIQSLYTKMQQTNPNFMITLVPQSDNIMASGTLNNTYANYSALIMYTTSLLNMSTASWLSWVGVQLYNTGCIYGLDGNCYGGGAAIPTNPDLAVAAADDLLQNWPAVAPNRREFLPYVSYLNPSQVVLGYPIPGNAGTADGGPIAPTSVIQQGITCLRTGSQGCGDYVPQNGRTYPNIGGVFGWEVMYDETNNFNFAQSLAPCVLGVGGIFTCQ